MTTGGRADRVHGFDNDFDGAGGASARMHRHPTFWSIGMARLAAVLLLVGLLGVPAQADAVDLGAPERGITDPLAGVSPLDRNCRTGQVDVNTAPADRIAQALNLASQPTIQRIVAG